MPRIEHYRTCISRVRWRRSFSVPVIELVVSVVVRRRWRPARQHENTFAAPPKLWSCAKGSRWKLTASDTWSARRVDREDRRFSGGWESGRIRKTPGLDARQFSETSDATPSKRSWSKPVRVGLFLDNRETWVCRDFLNVSLAIVSALQRCVSSVRSNSTRFEYLRNVPINGSSDEPRG